MVDTSDQNAEDEHLALNDADPADREDVWQDMLSTLLLPMSVHIPAPSRNHFRGQLRRQWMGDLALVDCRTGTFTGRRHRHQLGTDAYDFVAILLGVAGGENVNCADDTIRVRPSSGIAISGSHTFDFKVISNYHKRCLLVPNSRPAASNCAPQARPLRCSTITSPPCPSLFRRCRSQHALRLGTPRCNSSPPP
jgi:hypothetical protein